MMRYVADIDYDAFSAHVGEECASAKVRPSTWTKTPALALRHARAMAAVLRASKAEHMALLNLTTIDVVSSGRYAAASEHWHRLRQRAIKATARLVAVEKEVERG